MAFFSKRDVVTFSSGHSYLDGIPVKISEKCRPPRKITLPLSYQQHYPVDLLNEEYSFTLEKNVLEAAETQRRNREAVEKAKTEKLASTIEEFTRSNVGDLSEETLMSKKFKNTNGNQNFAKDAQLEDQTSLQSTTNNINSEISMSSSLLTSLEPNSILKPVPSTSVLDKPDVTMTCKFNLEDFESESSPFDSMALKTLNDLEELKSVLQNANVSDAPLGCAENGMQTMTAHQNGASGMYVPPTNDLSSSFPSAAAANFGVNYLPLKTSPNDDSNLYSQLLRSSHSTPDLLKEIGTSLSAEREKKKLTACQPKRPSSVGAENTIFAKNDSEKLETDKNVKVNLHDLVLHITDMGFPRAQVAYAVNHFGGDDKKVIEHLCLVQTMVELGYDSADAGAALIANNHNEIQTKEYLRLLVQFRDLGFDDTSIKNALQQFNNDRDKALDYLVS